MRKMHTYKTSHARRAAWVVVLAGWWLMAMLAMGCSEGDESDVPAPEPTPHGPVDGGGEEPTPGGETPTDTKDASRFISGVDEYCPAPGQFVNALPEITADDDEAAVLRKCTESLSAGGGGMVTLGGYGGYVTFHFDHAIVNVAGAADLKILGNAFAGNSEPGIVMVAEDTNGNGKPDDTWYELAGSADTDSVGKVRYGYSITYRRVPMGDIPWKDNLGNEGVIGRNDYHEQEYFPLWKGDELTFSGTLLPPNAHPKKQDDGSTVWTLDALRFGYVDNVPNNDATGNNFDLDWAVDEHRQPVNLKQIHFVRVYNAQNQQCGWIGETSTEVSGAEDLNY